MDKARKFEQLMLEYDKLAHRISQLKSTNGGINLSDEILKEIDELKIKQNDIERQAIVLQQNL
jgi:hypothetical protein